MHRTAQQFLSIPFVVILLLVHLGNRLSLQRFMSQSKRRYNIICYVSREKVCRSKVDTRKCRCDVLSVCLQKIIGVICLTYIIVDTSDNDLDIVPPNKPSIFPRRAEELFVTLVYKYITGISTMTKLETRRSMSSK